MMQLGLRFAAAKLPVCGPAESSETSWSSGPWWPEEAIEDSELCYRQPVSPL